MSRSKHKSPEPQAAWYEDGDEVALAVRPFRDAWLGYCVHVPHDPDHPHLAADCLACCNALLDNALGSFNGVARALERAGAAWTAPGAEPRRSR